MVPQCGDTGLRQIARARQEVRAVRCSHEPGVQYADQPQCSEGKQAGHGNPEPRAAYVGVVSWSKDTPALFNPLEQLQVSVFQGAISPV